MNAFFVVLLFFSVFLYGSKDLENILKQKDLEIIEKSISTIYDYQNKKNCLSSHDSSLKAHQIIEKCKSFIQKSILNIDFYSSQISDASILERSKQAIKKGNKILELYQKYIKEQQILAFLSEKEEDINPNDKKGIYFLAKLKMLAREFYIQGADRFFEVQKDFTKSVFKEIFEYYFFINRNLSCFKSENGDLSKQNDCKVLENAYKLWSIFYDMQNNQNQNDKIPLYNVNAHNDLFKFWLKEKIKGNIPMSGLPLIHVDSHPDFGPLSSLIMSEIFELTLIRFLDISELIDILLSEKDFNKKLFLDKFEELLEKKYRSKSRRLKRLKADGSILYLSGLNEFTRYDYEKKIISRIINWFSYMSKEQVLSNLEKLAVGNVNYICNITTGAVNSNITNDLIMCMPPWSLPYTKTPKKNEFYSFSIIEIKKFNTDYEYPYKLDHILSHKINHNISHRLYHILEKSSDDKLKLANMDCFEKSIDFSNILEKQENKDFILDIDLDFAATNGDNIKIEGVIGDPISNKRSKSGIELEEMKLIKTRMISLIDKLKSSIQNGYKPKIISIADSTELEIISNELSFSGGNFTPKCAAFLINYYIRSEIAKLFSTNDLFFKDD